MSNPSLVESFASSLTASSFFDNPAGSAELLRPMDVRKPSEAELKKATPGLEVTPANYTLHETTFTIPTTNIPVTHVTVIPQVLPAEWQPLEGVVNKTQFYDTHTPNLFFRFHSQLYYVYCSIAGMCCELHKKIQQVRAFPSIHRRRWRCAARCTHCMHSRCSSTVLHCLGITRYQRWV